MVAISANSNASDQSANSTNASSFGFINNSYRDRYIPVRKDLTADEINPNQASESPREKANFDSILKAQQKFNAAIQSFYDNNFKPSKDDVSQATNYYIERSTKTNNQPGPTRSSAMIPVSVNFTTDGISGFHMGQAFTLPSDILPYTYSTRHTPTLKDVTDTNPTADVKVAFATVGLSHTIQGNVWDTSIKGNMILIKDQNAFSNAKINTDYNNAPLLSPILNVSTPGSVAIDPSSLNVSGDWINKAFQFISSKEGFDAVAKWDVNHFRGGYGSDKKLVGNQLQNTVQGTTFTRKEAEDTLKYEIVTDYSKRVINVIGQAAWDALSDNQKASLTSFAYNTGTINKGISGAIQSKNYSQAAQIIASGPYTAAGKYLSGLELRRKEESALFNKIT
jgi:GH24 family phage-related lysozyme (muramidase)